MAVITLEEFTDNAEEHLGRVFSEDTVVKNVPFHAPGQVLASQATVRLTWQDENSPEADKTVSLKSDDASSELQRTFAANASLAIQSAAKGKVVALELISDDNEEPTTIICEKIEHNAA